MGKFKNIFIRILSVLAVFGVGMTFVSCEPEGLVDNSEFVLYYPGISDVGPSCGVDIPATYYGAKPSDFKITKVTADGSWFETEAFQINSETGAFSLVNSDYLPIATYKISVSCMAGGKLYEYADIITINIMKPAPKEIKVEPNELTVLVTDISNTTPETVLPTAQVTTDGDHISISGYALSNIYRDGVNVTDKAKKFFTVSNTGLISIEGWNPDIVAGKYVIDLRLTTYLVDESKEEGLFANALTIDVVSIPTGLTYTPALGKIEQGLAGKSPVPVLSGSQEEPHYELLSVSPENVHEFFSVEAETGVINVKDGHTGQIGDRYTVSIKARNAYGEAELKDVYTFEVVDFIDPITKFSYEKEFYDPVYATAFELNVAEMDGDEVTYSFVDLDDELVGQITIDPQTGKISAVKGNTIPMKSYDIKVKVSNVKGEMVTNINLLVKRNPNFFTTVRWGNNLDLPVEGNADQFRFFVGQDTQLKFSVVSNDIPEGASVEYKFTGGFHDDANWCGRLYDSGLVTIDPQTGEITMNEKTTKVVDNQTQDVNGEGVYMAKVTVTVGEGDIAYSNWFPVFFHYSKEYEGITITYTPFVFQCNPRRGGKSVAPVIEGGGDNFVADYRRSFRYLDLSASESYLDGRSDFYDGTNVNWIRSLMTNFYVNSGANGGQLNQAARLPYSYWDKSMLNGQYVPYRLLYVDPKDDFRVNVAANKWILDGKPANGMFTGQWVIGTDGKDPQSAGATLRPTPIAIWFDEKF